MTNVIYIHAFRHIANPVWQNTHAKHTEIMQNIDNDKKTGRKHQKHVLRITNTWLITEKREELLTLDEKQ